MFFTNALIPEMSSSREGRIDGTSASAMGKRFFGPFFSFSFFPSKLITFVRQGGGISPSIYCIVFPEVGYMESCNCNNPACGCNFEIHPKCDSSMVQEVNEGILKKVFLIYCWRQWMWYKCSRCMECLGNRNFYSAGQSQSFSVQEKSKRKNTDLLLQM